MSRKKPYRPWFPFYAQDFQVSTAEFSCEEVGLYVTLLCVEWVNGSLPTDHQRLQWASHSTAEEFDRCWPMVSTKFVDNGEGRLINLRLEEVREEQDRFTEQKSRAGLASAAARRRKANGTKDFEPPFGSDDDLFPTEGQQRGQRNPTNQNQTKNKTTEGEAASRPAPRKRKHMLPEDWQVDGQLLTWAKKETPAVDVKTETEIFRDHFHSAGTTKLDWRKAWQVWMRKEQRGASRKKKRFTRTDAERVGRRENKIKLSGESWEMYTDRMQALDENYT